MHSEFNVVAHFLTFICDLKGGLRHAVRQPDSRLQKQRRELDALVVS